MILPDLPSRKYFRWLMVAACKLNSESKAKNVLLCQAVILSSNLRRLQWNAQRGRAAVFRWIYEFPVWTQNVLLRLFMKDKAFRKQILQSIFLLRCLIGQTWHFLSFLFCQSPVKRWFTPVGFKKTTGY